MMIMKNDKLPSSHSHFRFTMRTSLTSHQWRRDAAGGARAAPTAEAAETAQATPATLVAAQTTSTSSASGLSRFSAGVAVCPLLFVFLEMFVVFVLLVTAAVLCGINIWVRNGEQIAFWFHMGNGSWVENDVWNFWGSMAFAYAARKCPSNTPRWHVCFE